jgi:hypothetical protein
MELRENRTELERLLGDVWDYEDVGHETSHLPKWLFALTLAAAVTCTSSPRDIVSPVLTALAPGPEKLSIDTASSQNVAEDLDYRIARHTDSIGGWQAFLAAHPDGPHAEAARAALGQPQPAPSSEPEQSVATADAAPAPAATPVMVQEEERAPSPQPVEVAEHAPPPSSTATERPAFAAQPAATAPPPMAKDEAEPPVRTVEVAETPFQSLPATQGPSTTPPAAAPAVVAETEPGAAPDPIAALADPPLPPSRRREIAAAKPVQPVEPVEPAHHSHWRAVHRQADRPNALTILIAQLFHHHGQRPDIRTR